MCVCIHICIHTCIYTGFLGGSDGKEPACSAGDAAWISDWVRSPGKGMATLSGILAWRIPWLKEPAGLESMESQRVTHD